MRGDEAKPADPNDRAPGSAISARPDVPSSYIAPRDELESQLTKLWERVLDIPNIGVKDNFFELTAARFPDNRLVDHASLRAVSLFHEIGYDPEMRRIRGKSRQALPVSTLLQAPTVEELAKILREIGQTSSWSPLVPIQQNGPLPPFYLVHGAGAHVNFCYYLAHHLGCNQPFYGIQSRGLDGKRAPHRRIEDMATDYINEICTFQPQGPYFLGGRSMGGAIAFEMAHQLLRQGHEVAFLALFDAYGPGFLTLTAPKSAGEDHDVESPQRLGTKEKVTNALQRTKGRLERKKKKMGKRLWEVGDRFYQGLGRPLPPALQNVQRANHKAFELYVPRQYPGSATLFRAMNQPKRCEHSPDLGWSGLFSQGLEVIDVPGTHSTIYHPPHVTVLAERLRACLAESRLRELGATPGTL